MRFRIFTVAAGALLALMFAHFSRRERTPTLIPAAPETASAPTLEQAPEPLATLPASPAAPLVPGTNSPPVSATNWLQRLLSENEIAPLPREVIDRWVASNGTNAESLLAARQAGGGREYLRQALTNFPNDPRVLFAAVALDDDPQARRERLDRFKAAAPDNALVDFLSARDHFKNSQPEFALADLQTATQKAHFQDYALDAMQNTEDLYLQAGKSPVEAKGLAASSTLLPHLAQLKGLAQEMAAMQRQYQASGDAASAERLAQVGLQLGEQLTRGEGSRCLINQLVGAAVERIVLGPLDAEQNYEFLQGSVREHLTQLDTWRVGVKQDTTFLNQWMANASEAELISYFDRFKIYGESSALAWLRQRHGAASP